MPNYRITINLKSPLGTELVSGTLWGHLAWALRYLEGDASFSKWMEEQELHPWLISSQMPVGMVPRPLLEPGSRKDASFSLHEMELDKRVRKVKFIPEAIFLKLRKKMSDEALSESLRRNLQDRHSKQGLKRIGIKAHNQINRHTGTTPQSGGLFFEEVEFPGSDNRGQVFLQTMEPCIDRLEALFKFVGESGFGANASSGNGCLGFALEEEKLLFADGGARAVSLSHGIITTNMQNPRYKQHVHFGKLGGDYAKGSFSPFKHPLLMAQPGATFDPTDGGPFGTLLRGVHHDLALAHIRHYALHLALRFTEVNP